MKLKFPDWIAVVTNSFFNLAIRLYFHKRASGSPNGFLVSGRKGTWWLAGTSMVATTFAADTRHLAMTVALLRVMVFHCGVPL